jgi:integrase
VAASGAQPGRGRRTPTVRPREVSVIDESETAWLLEVSQGTRLYIAILLAVALGLRRGEILAVRWRDFNTTAATITVSRSLEETKVGGLRFKEAKHNRSRSVAAPTLLTEALEAYRVAQDKLKADFATDYQAGDLVPAGRRGVVAIRVHLGLPRSAAQAPSRRPELPRTAPQPRVTPHQKRSRHQGGQRATRAMPRPASR